MSDVENTNGWTPLKKVRLTDWQQQSRLYSLGHGRAQELFIKKNNKIQIPAIAIGAIAALMDGIALLLPSRTIPFVLTALILTAIVTICNGILQVTKPEDSAAKHADMAKGYNKIVLQISSMLAKDPDERQNGVTFLSGIEAELIALETGGVKIPSSVWTTVKNDFTAGKIDIQKGDDGIIKPSETNDVTPPTHAEGVIPRFELKIDDDPKSRSKQKEKIMFDFHTSRLGP